MNLLFTSAITLGFICAIVHSLCLCLASLCILCSAFSYHIFPLSQRTIHPNCSFLVHQDHPEFPVLVWQLLFFISQVLFWLIHYNIPYFKAATMSSLILPPKTLLVLTFLATYYLKAWPSMSNIFHLHSVPSYSLEVKGYYKIWCHGLFFTSPFFPRSGGRLKKYQASEKNKSCGDVFTHQDPSSQQRNRSELQIVINIWKKLKFQKKSCY